MISSPLDRAIYHRIKKQICINSSFKEWTREEAGEAFFEKPYD